MEQEFELIIGKQNLQRSFTKEWREKWVPAIITYAKRLKRKDVKDIIHDIEKGKFCLHIIIIDHCFL